METNKIKRIVIWGLRKKYHTHRHIHQAFYKNAKKLSYETIWVEDEKESQKYIQPGDLIITADPVGRMVPEKFKIEDYNLPIREDIFYCLHNLKEIFTKQLKRENFINLAVYSKGAEESDIKIDTARYFDSKTRTLYQPWGTDLLAEEFMKPVFNKNKFVFWVGSIWNNKLDQGNLREIDELKRTLKANKISFIKVRFIPDLFNRFLVRVSRIAPAIAGKYQVDTDYLPCRMFKNISYGQLGITNVKKFMDILGDSYVQGETIAELIQNSLELSKESYFAIIRKQQEIVKKYTYKESIENIIKFLNK
ncbi:MAG: hypothetical protein WCQ00_01695 [bacterium]